MSLPFDATRADPTDLKPENLLFRDKAEDADLCLADFGVRPATGLSLMLISLAVKGARRGSVPALVYYLRYPRLHGCENRPGLWEVLMTSPRSSRRPATASLWTFGPLESSRGSLHPLRPDISYFLLCGYTPFDAGSPAEEMGLIVKGAYKFAPVSSHTCASLLTAQEEYWTGVSEQARDFVRRCLTVDPTNRPTIAELLADPWLKSSDSSAEQGSVDLLPTVKSGFDAKKTWRKAVFGVVAVQRMNATFHSGQSDAEKQKFIEQVERYKAEAEQVGLALTR